MKKIKFTALLLALALFTGVFAHHNDTRPAPAPDAKPDTTGSVSMPAQAYQSSLGKQTSVQRPTKRTNWSKIKTLFE